jgi:hypothetical protein
MAGDILLKGYLASAANWLSTELNSLADGSVCALSSVGGSSGEFDNGTDLAIFADVQIDLASLTISSTSAFVAVYVIPTVDGTNYPDWSSGAVGNYHQQYLAGIAFVKNVSATTARANLTGVAMPPGKYKVAVRNGLGAAFASSGNTVKFRAYAASYT